MITNSTTPALCLDDLTLIPAPYSLITSRKECNPYINTKGALPLFTAPMSSIIDETNWVTFANEGISTIIPRTVPIEIRLELMTQTFIAVSVEEFIKFFCTPENQKSLHKTLTENNQKAYICLDIANGHVKAFIDLCEGVKKEFRDTIQIMAGNIANPAAYMLYVQAGIDYVRVGIGTGSQCTTSANTGVHFPMATLLEYINNIKSAIKDVPKPKIVADGGFKNYDDIIKALALGADYVMLGKVFAECQEACGPIKSIWKNGEEVFMREYFGMSTKKAQSLMGKSELKTSEGISSMVEVKYPLKKYVTNFKDYLRSALSYANCRDVSEFRRKAVLTVISPLARNTYFK